MTRPPDDPGLDAKIRDLVEQVVAHAPPPPLVQHLGEARPVRHHRGLALAAAALIAVLAGALVVRVARDERPTVSAVADRVLEVQVLGRTELLVDGTAQPALRLALDPAAPVSAVHRGGLLCVATDGHPLCSSAPGRHASTVDIVSASVPLLVVGVDSDIAIVAVEAGGVLYAERPVEGVALFSGQTSGAPFVIIGYDARGQERFRQQG